MDVGTRKIRLQGREYEYSGEVDQQGEACGLGAMRLAESEIESL